MLPALHLLIGAVAIVAMFIVLVAPHEAGHMVMARLFGVRVYEYSIGMGTRIWSFTRDKTLYALRAIPLGGYCRLAGMEEGDFDAPDGFHRRPAPQRFAILGAGPLVNFLVAAVLITAVYLTQVNSDPGKVSAVFQGSPAAAQGIKPGDHIDTVNGQPIRYSSQIRQVEQASPGRPVTLGMVRPDGSRFTATVTPHYDSQNHAYLIGVQPAPVITPLDAIWGGVRFPVVATGAMVGGIAALITGQIPGGAFGPEGVTGAVGIGALTYQQANQGFFNWLQLAALLSMALGLANLLPLPALDGGRMVVVLMEALRGRPFDREREMAIQRAGLMALLALMVLIAFLDVQRIATGQFPGLK